MWLPVLVPCNPFYANPRSCLPVAVQAQRMGEQGKQTSSLPYSLWSCVVCFWSTHLIHAFSSQSELQTMQISYLIQTNVPRQIQIIPFFLNKYYTVNVFHIQIIRTISSCKNELIVYLVKYNVLWNKYACVSLRSNHFLNH